MEVCFLFFHLFDSGSLHESLLNIGLHYNKNITMGCKIEFEIKRWSLMNHRYGFLYIYTVYMCVWVLVKDLVPITY